MRVASFQSSADPHHASLRRRGVSLALTILAHLLILLMLLRLTPATFFPPKAEGPLKTFQIAPEGVARAKAITKARKQSGGSPRHAAAKSATPTPPAAATAPPSELSILHLSHDEMASLDLAMATHTARSGTGAGTGVGASTGADDGSSMGPNGQRLYNAAWYKEPTDAELAFYLPKDRHMEGWGLIACRTIADYRVEDCIELGESPAGSGLSRAVREAAWQFRVRPPRVDGHSEIGAWVKIRIDYTERGADPHRGG